MSIFSGSTCWLGESSRHAADVAFVVQSGSRACCFMLQVLGPIRV